MIDVTSIRPIITESQCFPDRLRELRQRLVGKQLTLSVALGYTDAAVSFWESGRRTPGHAALVRIIDTFARGGASPVELSRLHFAWMKAKAEVEESVRARRRARP
jgi:transcriptional regulator with XRE-family HTH domain